MITENDIKESHHHIGGWSWVAYECGVEMAYRLGDNRSSRLILGIMPQPDECRILSQNFETDDVI